MELVINELSFFPLAETSAQAETRFRGLIKAFESAKTKYGFSHMCFPQNYRNIQVTSDESFIQWITNIQGQTIKNAILTLCKKPYTDDLKDEELNQFYESNYTIVGDSVPTTEEPYGLPVAHIKSVPSISFNSHLFWNNRKILVNKSNTAASEDTTFLVFNICNETDIQEQELNEWADKSFSSFIIDEEKLITYLSYTKYGVTFDGGFIEQLLIWKNSDITTYRKVLLLMKDVELHPFTGGLGKTENLGGRGKEGSKRINHGDRLSYTLDKNIIHFIACIGHYDFH